MTAPSLPVRYRTVAGAQVRDDAALRRRLGELCGEAFGAPPYDGSPEGGAAWAEDGLVAHAGYPGFALVLAEHGERLLGFAYGLLGAEEQWFTQTLRERLAPELAAHWLGQHGELVELAVSGAARGLGIGSRLHDEALAGIWRAGARTALLVVHAQAAPARALYAARGWSPIAEIGADSLLLGQLRAP